MKKRLFSILLSFAMVITMMPMATGGAWAATNGSGTQGDPWLIGAENESDVTAYFDGTTFYIHGSGKMKDFEKYADRPWGSSINDTITSAVIDSDVTNIGALVFASFKSLSNVNIPSKATSIGSQAFYECTSLCDVEIPSSVTRIGNSAFNGTGLTSVTIPASVIEIGERAFTRASLTKIEVDEKNETYKSVDGVLFSKDMTTLICFPSAKVCTENTYTIPETVTSISTEAFRDCTMLTKITIPSSVTSIGTHAFLGCTGLTSMVIPENVTSIGMSTFHSCSNLKEVTIPSGVTSIGDYTFSGCLSLAKVTCLATTPPTLGTDAFKSCNVSLKIYVPAASVNTYKSATGWSTYADKIQAKPVTIADILPENFPTYSDGIPDNVWKNSAGSKMYINNNGLTFGGVSLYSILSNPVTKDGNNYKYNSNPYTITFVMDSDKLVKVITEGAENEDNNGEYIPPHIHAPVLVNGQAATESAAGWKDYYECACGALFEDENGTIPIENLATWKAEGGRGYIAPLAPAVDPTDSDDTDSGADTGDNSNLFLPVTLLILAILGAGAAIGIRRKEER